MRCNHDGFARGVNGLQQLDDSIAIAGIERPRRFVGQIRVKSMVKSARRYPAMLAPSNGRHPGIRQIALPGTEFESRPASLTASSVPFLQCLTHPLWTHMRVLVGALR